jgi:hypothetical protein
VTNIFPDRVVNDDGDASIQGGLTLRDYFAAHALSGLVTRDDLESVYSAVHKAYRLADIMLETRDQ